MHSSDTPENEELLPHDSPLLQRGEQGPVDWSREQSSDELLTPRIRHRLQEAFKRWQVERDQPGP
jgi:hypothetical protein